MIYGSVCSGIEAASVAWHPLGWRAAFLSEIEPFPRAVLKHHYPSVPLHGDFTTIQAGDYEPIDLLVGGTPCQSFSIAGLRGGLADERGNLALEFLRLVQRLRPRWVVWENVPGVLSATSHDAPDPCPPPDDLAEGSEWVGEDEYDADEDHAFSYFLAGLSEIGYGWAYRSLDAQFFGLAQRRERVFVVGYLGDWRRAAAVLFEPASLRGNPPPRREAGEGTTGTLSSRSTAGGGLGTDFECSGGIVPANSEQGVGAGLAVRQLPGDERRNVVPDMRMVRQRAYGGNRTTGHLDVATAVNAHGGPHGRLDFESETFVAVPLQEIGKRTGVSTTDPRTGIGIGQAGDPMFTLQAGAQHGVAVSVALRGREGGGIAELGDDCAHALRSSQGGGDKPYVLAFDPTQTAAVRRLVPEEAEALQGFPRGYTLISYRGRPAADGPRYRALGNSMAVPCMAWIGSRIAAQEAEIRASQQAAA